MIRLWCKSWWRSRRRYRPASPRRSVLDPLTPAEAWDLAVRIAESGLVAAQLRGRPMAVYQAMARLDHLGVPWSAVDRVYVTADGTLGIPAALATGLAPRRGVTLETVSSTRAAATIRVVEATGRTSMHTITMAEVVASRPSGDLPKEPGDVWETHPARCLLAVLRRSLLNAYSPGLCEGLVDDRTAGRERVSAVGGWPERVPQKPYVPMPPPSSPRAIAPEPAGEVVSYAEAHDLEVAAGALEEYQIREVVESVCGRALPLDQVPAVLFGQLRAALQLKDGDMPF